MKLSILQQDLLPPLQAVARSVGVRSTLPVLDNVLLSAEGKNLKLAATNLEIGVIKNLKVEIDSPGGLTVPAKTLVELIAGLGQGKLELEAEAEILTVKSGKFKATVNGIAQSEFPTIPESREKGVSFQRDVILTSSQILYAAAVDEGRPVLTGILTEVSGGKLDFVATDGFRLAHRRVEVGSGKVEGFRSLIPRRTFEEVLRILAEEEVEDVSISASAGQNQAIFTVGQTLISSRLIEGSFPAWEKIIPTAISARALVDKEDLLKAIKLAAIFSKDEANIVVLSTQKGLIRLKSEAKQLGAQENEVEGEVGGEELQIAFNTKFLLDAISNSPSSQVMMEFSGPLSACLLKPVGVLGLEYIVMPVRLS